MADKDIFQNNINTSEYAEYNYQKVFNSNVTFDNISTFAGSFNDIIRRTDFGIDFDNISTDYLDFINMVERSSVNPSAMITEGLTFKDINDKSHRTGVNIKSMMTDGFEINERNKRVDPYDARELPLYSYILVIAAGGEVARFDCVPISPESISESTGAIYNEQSFIGRSAPTQVYTGTNARSATITFKVHYEMATSGLSSSAAAQKIKLIKEQLAGLRKAIYPKLLGPGYIPAITEVVIGSFRMKGLCKNISYNWQPPIVNGEFYCCEVSMQIDEILPASFGGLDSIFKSNPQAPFH